MEGRRVGRVMAFSGGLLAFLALAGCAPRDGSPWQTPYGVCFRPGATQLDPRAKTGLDEAIQMLKPLTRSAMITARIYVDEEKGRELAAERAKIVVAAMLVSGIDTGRIRAVPDPFPLRGVTSDCRWVAVDVVEGPLR